MGRFRYKPQARSAALGGLHYALRCADNVAHAVDRRMPEAAALAGWMDQERTALGLGDGEDFVQRTQQKTGLVPMAWRRVRATITRALRTTPFSPSATAELWLSVLCDRLRLDDLDRKILALALYYELDERVEYLVDKVNAGRGGGTGMHGDLNLLALLLASEPDAVETRLTPESALCSSGMLLIDNNGCLEVLGQLATLVRRSAMPKEDPFVQLLGATMPAVLPWNAFAHLGREADIAADLLTATLAAREVGVNILLYGPPGTGKTSFAATLAARVGASLRPITEQDALGGEPNRGERIAGLQLAQHLAPQGETVLLFDEAEDVFVRQNSMLGDTSGSSRVFMHRLLEGGPLPVIWTANDISVLGPAVLRRMTMCLELKIPGLAVRSQLWRRMGEAEGVLLAEADATRLARLVPAAPAVAATALRATRLAGGDAGTARLIVEGIARAVAGGRMTSVAVESSAHYDPALVNADQDLLNLAEQLARPDAPQAVSLLLSGPPGTGKSAFVRYLAKRMGLEVLQKRASDLLGPFVGETEANIAAAFAEAKEAGAFLIFDEADSLLGERAGAVRNWEVSQVNEMLTWMEQHPLPFACTTNLPDRLDKASLRRFLVKLRLNWLTGSQARLAFQQFFASEPPPGLDALRTLTPADFALVRRRAALTGEDNDQVALMEMLAAECDGREGTRTPIGFLAA